MDIQTILEGLKKPGKNRIGLASHMGWNPSTVTALLKGERRVHLADVPGIEEYLELEPTIAIVGIVRAGGEAFYPEPADLGRAITIPGAGPNTVAVEIQGNSLGSELDGWIAYYDDIHDPPSESLIGKLCVVGLKDGRIVLKTLRAAQRGRYHLFSSYADAITDVQVLWAARVIDIKPRDLAVK